MLEGTLDAAWRLGVRVLVHAAESGFALRRAAPVRWADGEAGTATFDARVAQMLTRLRVPKDSAAAPAQEVAKVLIAEVRGQAQLTIKLKEQLKPANFDATLEQARRLWRGFAKVPLNTETPFALLRSAYTVLRVAFDRTGRPTDVHIMALAMIAVAWRGIRRTRPCRVCFRWAVPGHMFCHDHSRSSSGRGTPRERDLRQKQAHRLRHSSRAGLAMRSGGITLERMPFVVARVLWNLRIGAEATMLRAAIKVINESSHLRAIPGLPGRAPVPSPTLVHSATLQSLRDALDPYEFDAPRWEQKLRAAHLWFEAQSRASGHRGGGKAMRARMLKACQLAEGGFNRSEIAQELGAAPSAITNWLNRYADPGHELHELRERLAQALERGRSLKLTGATRRELRRQQARITERLNALEAGGPHKVAPARGTPL